MRSVFLFLSSIIERIKRYEKIYFGFEILYRTRKHIFYVRYGPFRFDFQFAEWHHGQPCFDLVCAFLRRAGCALRSAFRVPSDSFLRGERCASRCADDRFLRVLFHLGFRCDRTRQNRNFRCSFLLRFLSYSCCHPLCLSLPYNEKGKREKSVYQSLYPHKRGLIRCSACFPFRKARCFFCGKFGFSPRFCASFRAKRLCAKPKNL